MKRLLFLCFLFLVSFSVAIAGNTLSVIGDEVVNGSTEATVGINLENPTDVVGGVQFDLFNSPYNLEVDTIIVTDRTLNFELSWNILAEGVVRVLLYDTENENISGITGEILLVTYDVTGQSNAANMIGMAEVVISDPVGNPLFISEVIPGYISVGLVPILSFGSGSGNAGEGDYLVEINMKNSDAVGGIQMDLVCDPHVLYVDSIFTTTRTDGFSVDFSMVGDVVRVLLYHTGGVDIAAGDGPILQVFLSVDPFAVSQDVNIGAINIEVGDPDGNHVDHIVNWNIFSIIHGYLFPPENLVATSGLDSQVPLIWEEPSSGATGEEQIYEGFEGVEYPPGWLMIDNDGGYNSQFEVNTNWMFYDVVPHSGIQSIVSLYNSDASPNDDWLITPMIKPGSTSEFRFWASPQDPNYSQEIFDIKISTESQDITTFSASVLHHEFPSGVGGTESDWIEFVVDLSDYAGDEIYVAIQCVSVDQFILKIDDILITELLEGPDIFMTINLRSNPSLLLGTKRSDSGYAVDPSLVNSAPFYKLVEKSTLIGYALYRSETSPVTVEGGNRIGYTDESTLAFIDTTAQNSTTYYYVVTADYLNEGESGPSNEAEATPVEWVDLYAGSVEGYAGDTIGVDVSLTNEETTVGGFEFLIVDVPGIVDGIEVIPSTRLTGSGWSVQGQEQADGSYKVIGFDINGVGIAPGTGPIVTISYFIYNVMEPCNVVLHLTGVVISDLVGNMLPTTPHDGNINVLVETQYLVIFDGQANPGDTGDVAISLVNTKPVGGFEFIIRDIPDYLTATNVIASSRLTDIAGGAWSVSGSEQPDGSYKVLGFDINGTSIPPGEGPITIISYEVDASAPIGVIDLILEGVVLSDPLGNQQYSEVVSGHFGIGQPDVFYYLANDTATVGCVGKMVVTMNNSATVSGFQFVIMDSADIFIGTGVISSLTGWTISGNELESGGYRVVGFSMSGATIPASSVTTFEVALTVDNAAVPGDYPVIMPEAIASDPDGVNMWAVGFPAIFTVLEIDFPPTPFSLLEPVDGTTWTYNYDFLTGAEMEVFKWERSEDPNGMPVVYGVIFGVDGYGEIAGGIPSDSDGADTTLTIPVKIVLDELASIGVSYPLSGTGYWYVLATDGANVSASNDTFDLNISIETGIISELAIPEKYELRQNFPNPFNPETNIIYGLPRESNVRIDVYNLLGQEVVTLVNEKQESGYHLVQWNGCDKSGTMMKSGIYIYQITSDGFSETKKMILLK